MGDVLRPGEKIHVITRRGFEGDLRRHFAGEVLAYEDGLARVRGYTFVFDQFRNEFVRRPETRTRILAIGDGAHVVNVLPGEVDIESLRYTQSSERRLVLTDGRQFRLDINEFGPSR